MNVLERFATQNIDEASRKLDPGCVTNKIERTSCGVFAVLLDFLNAGGVLPSAIAFKCSGCGITVTPTEVVLEKYSGKSAIK